MRLRSRSGEAARHTHPRRLYFEQSLRFNARLIIDGSAMQTPIRLERAALAAATLLAVTFAVDAAPFPPETEVWTRVETPWIELYANTDEDLAIEAARNLDVLRGVLVSIVRPADPASHERTVAFLFRNRRGFEPYRDRIASGSHAVGLFVRGDGGNYIATGLHRGRGELGALYHEYVHDFLSTYVPSAPLWLNEGLAELMSTFDHDASTASVGLPVHDHILWLRTHSPMPADRLFGVTRDSRDYHEGERQGTFYAESWLATHYFLFGGGDRTALQKYLVAIASGAAPDEAFGPLGMTPAELTARLESYAERDTYPWIRIPIEDTTGILDVRRADRSQLLYELGNLLYHSGPDNLTEAVDYYRAALRVDPSHPGANGVLGMILYGKGRRSEAAIHLARATEAMTTDFLPYLLHGENLLDRLRDFRITFSGTQTKPPEVDRARNLFERSHELNPDDPRALAGLGSTYLFESADVEPGIDALEEATARMPERTDLWVYLEILELKCGDRDRAQRIVDERIAPAGDADLLHSALRALVAWDVEQSNRFVRQGLLDDAARLLRRATATNDDADLAATLDANLHSVEMAIETLSLTELYNEAVRSANRFDYPTALSLLRQVVHETHDEDLRRDAGELIRTIEGFLRAAERSNGRQ